MTTPVPRKDWPTTAAAADVLGFKAETFSFKSLDERKRRSTFSKMAEALVDLGKGTNVRVNGTLESHPKRRDAYLDAITMGERTDLRRDMLSESGNASSCGVMIRNLYKMIGVKIPSYASDYHEGVIRTEGDFAAAHQARVNPGDKKTTTDENGASSTSLCLPQLGDAIYLTNRKPARPKPPEKPDPTKEYFSQHIFVVTGVGEEDDNHHLPNGTTVRLPRLALVALQGGQMYTNEFPGDGGCMGINQGVYEVKIDFDVPTRTKWRCGAKFVEWWIDIALLGDQCDDEPLITPVRNARY